MRILCLSITVSLILFQPCAKAQALRSDIINIASKAQGIVGVSILNIETQDTLSYNGSYHCPMQSVFKFPIAMAVLHEVDMGKLKLDQKIHFEKKDLEKGTWSPIADKYPEADVDITLDEILRQTVSHSDNIGCDLLLKAIGGPEKANRYIHSLGVKGMAIKYTEKQMHKGWKVQYENWCEPREMTHLLGILFKGNALSVSSRDFLYRVMTETTTGPGRIRGLLPKNTIVANKTGTGGRKNGIGSAMNDAGIISLPNGQHLAVTVFVTDAKADDETREAIIAKISKAAYDHWSK